MSIILNYHRINTVRPASDIWDLTVTLKNFKEHLDYLGSCHSVLPFEELEACMTTCAFPERAGFLSFDDGYYNNYALAKPALESAKLPATIFLATGFINQRSFWWDRLEAIVSARFAAAPDDKHSGQSSSTAQSAPSAVIWELWRKIRDLDPDVRDEFLYELSRGYGVSPDLDVENRPMTDSEVRALRSDMISVGSHTANHPWLPSLSPAEMRRQIAVGKECCEELTGGQVASFAYPYGAHDETTRSVAVSVGIRHAYTTARSRVADDCDPMAIPRLAVKNWSAEELACEIRLIHPH